MPRPRKPKPPPKTRWERSADRENDRRYRKASLFVHAGLVPLATPEERQVLVEGWHRQAEENDEERQREEEARIVATRAEVAAGVTPEKLAELDARMGRDGISRGHILSAWTGALAELRGEQPATACFVPRERGRAVAQLPLFAEAPSGVDVPLVDQGKAIPVEILAAAHGIDLEAPVMSAAPPCQDCGWVPTKERSVINLDIHPPGCPSFRAFLLGLRENCADCKARRAMFSSGFVGPCEAHRARTLACANEGCLPAPAPIASWNPDGTHVLCIRCGCAPGAIEKIAYLRPCIAA